MSLDNLPVEWSVIDLESLSEFIIGGDWGKDTSLAEENYIEAFCIRGAEFKNWKTDKGKTAVPRKLKTSSLDTRRLKIGDILVEISGGGPDQPVGRTVYIEELVFKNLGSKDIVCTNFLRLFRPTSFINAKYLNFYLSFFYKTPAIVNYQSGSNNLRNLQFKDYLKLEIPIASLAEQQEIVRQLDLMLAQVEQIKARLDAIPAILKKFRQSVLADALSGKLIDFPEGSFNEYTLSDFAKIIDPQPSHRTPPISLDGIPYIGIGDLDDSTGEIDFDNARKVSKDVLKEHQKRYQLQKGDFIFGKIGTIGKPFVLPIDRAYTLSANVILIQPRKDIIPEYLYFYLSSPLVMKEILGDTNSTSQAAFGIKKMRALNVKIPNLEIQQIVVDKVNGLIRTQANIEKKIDSAQKRVNLLTQSILAKAFSGELTAEWREQHQDFITGINSAESLLAKIQAKREASKPVKKTRAKKEV